MSLWTKPSNESSYKWAVLIIIECAALYLQTVPVQDMSNLLTYIESSQLTPSFGGSLTYDHKSWIRLQKVLNSLVSVLLEDTKQPEKKIMNKKEVKYVWKVWILYTCCTCTFQLQFFLTLGQYMQYYNIKTESNFFQLVN